MMRDVSKTYFALYPSLHSFSSCNVALASLLGSGNRKNSLFWNITLVPNFIHNFWSRILIFGIFEFAETINEIQKAKIAIPGKMTSAFLLLQLMIGKFDYIEMNFSDIPLAVKNGKVDAGLVIHETQLSYSQEGIIKILDVGEWWDKTTDGLPVPLGINVMKDSFGLETIRKFDKFLQESIQFGLNHNDDAIEYAMKYGRGKPRDLIEKFVKMYVNDVTVNMGENGEKSIRRLFEMALQKNLVPEFNLKIA